MDEKKPDEGDDEMLAKIKKFLLNLLKSDTEIQEAVGSISSASKAAAGSHALKEKDAEIARLKVELKQLQDQAKDAQADERRSREKADSLQQEVDGVKRDLAASRKLVELLTTEKAALEKKYASLDESVKQLRDEKAALAQKYAALGELETAYNVYNSLPQNIQVSMAGFIRGDSLLGFAASGMRDSRLDMFWEFCRTEVQKSGGLQYAPNIAAIFEFFFVRINTATESPLYELFTPEAGRRFDSESMIVSNSSAVKDGVIEKTVFPGYSGTSSKKTVKKAIVTLA